MDIRSIVRRYRLRSCVSGIALSVLPQLLSGQTVIDTRPLYTVGSTGPFGFGSVRGQLFTAPAGVHDLTSFSLFFNVYNPAPTLTFELFLTNVVTDPFATPLFVGSPSVLSFAGNVVTEWNGFSGSVPVTPGLSYLAVVRSGLEGSAYAESTGPLNSLPGDISYWTWALDASGFASYRWPPAYPWVEEDQVNFVYRAGFDESPPTPPTVTPEPATLLLLGTGLLGLGLVARLRTA